jgi:hypothetical protein
MVATQGLGLPRLQRQHQPRATRSRAEGA